MYASRIYNKIKPIVLIRKYQKTMGLGYECLINLTVSLDLL